MGEKSVNCNRLMDTAFDSHVKFGVNLDSESNKEHKTKAQNSHICHLCGMGYADSSSLLRHMRTHAGGKVFTCSECGQGFTDSSYLKKHVRCHTGERPYVCEMCGKGFTAASYLQRHRRIHTGEKPYICKTCGKGFPASCDLQRHIKSHTGEKPFTCEVCGKGFSEMSKLKRHNITHTGEKPYKCEVCEKSFSSSSSLKQHVRTHAGDKPYSCDICGRAYADIIRLKRHMKVHTQAKCYRCELCEKSFLQMCQLIAHSKTHSGEKSYMCDICQNGFRHAGDLRRHVLTHTGERPFKCEDCGRGFTQSAHLKKHKKVHSQGEVYKVSFKKKKGMIKNTHTDTSSDSDGDISLTSEDDLTNLIFNCNVPEKAEESKSGNENSSGYSDLHNGGSLLLSGDCESTLECTDEKDRTNKKTTGPEKAVVTFEMMSTKSLLQNYLLKKHTCRKELSECKTLVDNESISMNTEIERFVALNSTVATKPSKTDLVSCPRESPSQSWNEIKSLVQCRICNLEFDTPEEVERHVETDHGGGNSSSCLCQRCNKVFSSSCDNQVCYTCIAEHVKTECDV